jgi:DNA-binding transcriptional MerR regulator
MSLRRGLCTSPDRLFWLDLVIFLAYWLKKGLNLSFFQPTMIMNAPFPTDMVLKVTGASANQLKYWIKIGLIGPHREGKRYFYTFRDIIKLRVISNLKNKGLSLQKIRNGIDNLTKVLPREDDPLSRLVIFTDGQDMIAMEKGAYFSATSLQRYFRFDMGQLHARITKIQSEEGLKEKVPSPQLVFPAH